MTATTRSVGGSASRRWAWPGLLAGLGLFFALSLAQMVSTSPTFDEGFGLLRGYAAWRTGHLLPIGHPPLAHWLIALGVSLEPDLPDPARLAGWAQDQYDLASQELLWHSGLNTERLVFLGRYTLLLAGLVLGALTVRWARELFGWGGALAAGLLHALSPNLLANAALATTDIPITLTFLLTLYAWHRYTRRPGWRWALAVGAAAGLAWASKFSALVLIPILAALALLDAFTHRAPARLRPLLAAPPAAVFALWAAYGFGLSPYPLAGYFVELGVFLGFARTPQTAFLLGQLAAGSFPGYYLVAFAVKTPLTVLGLAGLALLRGRAFLLRQAGLLVPLVLFFLATAFSALDLGYRYLLPILPLVHVLAAGGAVGPLFRARRWAVPALLGVNLVSTLHSAPAFIPYFNESVGLDNGYTVLSDSNVDWGQDLPALARYLNGRPVYLAYFGLADPGYYGIQWKPLPSWPPPLATDFVPADPEPGLYAISASNLVGVQLLDVNALSYFQQQTPLAVINHSIFIFSVPERAPAEALALCQPPSLDEAALAAILPGRRLRRFPVDCATTFVQPAAPVLTLYMDDAQPWLDLGRPAYTSIGFQGAARFRVYRSEPAEAAPAVLARGPYLDLLDYTLADGTLTLRWQVTAPAPPPASVFVHLLTPEGALAAAYDALGFTAEYWQAGDRITQRYVLAPLPPAGDYTLAVGLYALQTDGQRYSEFPLTMLHIP